MNEEILTFREWSENFVKVKFELHGLGGVEVFSFDKRIYSSLNRTIVNDLLINTNKVLLKLYSVNFDIIQNDYQNLITQSV
jgi:hypothetical protein